VPAWTVWLAAALGSNALSADTWRVMAVLQYGSPEAGQFLTKAQDVADSCAEPAVDAKPKVQTQSAASNTGEHSVEGIFIAG